MRKKTRLFLKMALFFILGFATLIIGFVIWFFVFFLEVPELNIPEKSSKKEKVVLIDNWLKKLNSERKFNGGVLILNDGKPILEKTYGFTNFKKTDSLNVNSSFRLASVSKQFTASGIMLLKEKELIDYDDLVSKYISNFPYNNVTIRNLLNQTSGIPDSYVALAEKFKDEIGVLTNEKVIALLVANKPKSVFNPNDKYEYSNINYVILARIIELVSGQSFENYMKDQIFIPLGMKSTRVWNLISKDKTFKGKTDGFEDLAGEVSEVVPAFIDGVAGDGAVFSSVSDFVIWDKFWYENQLISNQNLQEAFKKPKLNNGELSNYGFGWVIVNEDVVMHNGAYLAANTWYIRNTKKKSSFVLLDNSSNLFFDKIISGLK